MKKYFKLGTFMLTIAIIVITLTSGDIKGSRSGGGKDLVEELYDQAVKQNDNLKSIEEGIEKFYKNKNEAIEKYNSFTSYNNRYYADAKTKAITIADAVAKQKANDIISKSEAAYRTKTADWQNTISTLNANERELNDLHALLQVFITEPIIAKFQNSELPNSAKAKEMNSELLKVIEKIKVITK